MTEQKDAWLSELSLETVFRMFADNGVTEILYKVLPQNANSKNQVYLGQKDASEFAKIPTGDVTGHVSISKKTGKKEAIFHAPMEFYWLTQEGELALAPEAKLIFYPQYPETRFSGFLRGCKASPSSLMTKEKRGTDPGRLMLWGLGNGEKVIGLVLPPEAPATKEVLATPPSSTYGVFNMLEVPWHPHGETFEDLMKALCAIHQKDWVRGIKLNSAGLPEPCNASNCNGYTLEALLGIRPNGFSLPDYLGWEVKARQVTRVERPGASTITLFTPEPTLGEYAALSIRDFIRRFGYPDRKGRSDRLNVGGIHRVNSLKLPPSGLRMFLDGYDVSNGEFDPNGAVILLNKTDTLVAGWPFLKLMDHWKKKHARAVYVPCQSKVTPERAYKYGSQLILGEGADFKRVLQSFHDGLICYDPGIKLEGVSTPNPSYKKRSQFRVSSKQLSALYERVTVVDACSPPRS